MYLKTTNIGALEGTHTFEFSDSMNALIGPNGCGKSTVVGALFFAITGETLTHCTLDSLITWGHDTGSVVFSCDVCTITRTISTGKPQKASLTYPGGKTKELTRQDDINDAVMTAFNIIDKAAFRQVFFAEQFKAIDILDAGNSKRLEILAALLGLSRFEKFRSVLANASSSVFTERVGQALIDNLSERIKASEERIASRTEELKNLKTLSVEEINKLKQLCLMMTKEEFAEVSQSIQSLEKELEAALKRLADLPEPLTTAEINSINSAKRLKDFEKELEDLAQAEEEAKKPVSPSSNQVQLLINNILQHCAGIDAKKKEVQSRLTLLHGGKCPITGGEPCSDLVKFVNPQTIKDEVEALEANKAESGKDLDELKDMLKNAQEKEAKNAAIIAECKKLRKQIESLQQFADIDITALEARIKQMAEHKEQREKLLVTISGIEFELKSKKKSIQGLTEDALPTQEDKKKAEEAIQEFDETSRVKLQLETERKAAVDENEQAKKSMRLVDEQNERAGKGEEAVAFFTEVRNVLHKDQLPALLVSKLRKSLNKRLSLYLELFEFPYTAMWTVDGSLVYNTTYGETFPAVSLSGGQKYVLAIANRCALADTLGARFPLMVLDEPTTGLDEFNKNKMAQLLQKVSVTLSGKGVSLIVPTHDAELLVNANVIKVDEA